MASPGNQHCANCIDTLSFLVHFKEVFEEANEQFLVYTHYVTGNKIPCAFYVRVAKITFLN